MSVPAKDRAINDVDDRSRTEIEDGAARERAGLDGDGRSRTDIERGPADISSVGDEKRRSRGDVECDAGSAATIKETSTVVLGSDAVAGGHAEFKDPVRRRRAAKNPG